MQQATNAILRGGTIMTPSVSAKTIAEQLAEKINAKLNYTPVEKLEEERQAAEQAETIKRYEEELEINDFPQVSSTQCTKHFSTFLFLFLIFVLVFPLPGEVQIKKESRYKSHKMFFILLFPRRPGGR